ncbi:MAG: hypothetical protein GY715_05160 [Planctomycetes bacterium]|nr:hypothetical protein [Planctomycetota bacterium]
MADALADIVEAAAGGIPRPAELCRILTIDKKLGWKISKVVQARDPLAAVEHIPGAAGVEIFLTAASRRGASDDLLDRARAAMRRFDRLIEVHAGDRGSFEMMARGIAEESSDQSEFNHRRAAFRGNSYTWGVQARTQLSTNIVYPSKEPGRLDIALVGGLIELRRLRPKVAWVVARLGFVGDSDEPHSDASIENTPVPLLTEFCTEPPSALQTVRSPSGFIEVELAEGPVGDTGAMTFIFCGEPFRNAGRAYRTDDDPVANLNVHVRTPSKVLIHDLLVHASLFDRLHPQANIYSEVHHEVRSSRTRLEKYRLPVGLTVDYLGRGSSVLRTPDVPRYPEMARHVLERVGQDAEEFDAYRLRMQYPIVPTAVTMGFDLPEE